MRSLLHLSDVHFGPKHLPALAGAVAALVERERPDVVVVSGDLTQRAKPSQFRAAREWVAGLERPFVFAPGNHDVPLWRIWERILDPFGAWRRHFWPALEHDYVDEAVAILAVTTAFPWTTKHGRLRADQLANLDRRLAAAPASAARIVVAHHPLGGAAELAGEPPASGGAAALALCAARGVELVLSGHLHYGFVVPGGEGRPALVHTGTSTSSRGRRGETGTSSINWIEIGPDSTRIERRLWLPAARRFETAERIDLPRLRTPRPAG